MKGLDLTKSEESDVMETYGLSLSSNTVKPVEFEQFNESVRLARM